MSVVSMNVISGQQDAKKGRGVKQTILFQRERTPFHSHQTRF